MEQTHQPAGTAQQAQASTGHQTQPLAGAASRARALQQRRCCQHRAKLEHRKRFWHCHHCQHMAKLEHRGVSGGAVSAGTGPSQDSGGRVDGAARGWLSTTLHRLLDALPRRGACGTRRFHAAKISAKLNCQHLFSAIFSDVQGAADALSAEDGKRHPVLLVDQLTLATRHPRQSLAACWRRFQLLLHTRFTQLADRAGQGIGSAPQLSETPAQWERQS